MEEAATGATHAGAAVGAAGLDALQAKAAVEEVADGGTIQCEAAMEEAGRDAPQPEAAVEEVANELAIQTDVVAEVAEADAAAVDERPTKRRRGIEAQQTILVVENGPKAINCAYAQLQPPSHPSLIWRKIDDFGGWSGMYLYFDAGHWRFRPEVEVGNTRCHARGSGAESAPELCTWQVKREKGWEDRAMSVAKVDHCHLRPAARRAAKDAWRERLAPTRFRCAAKGKCEVSVARDWGVQSEADLYAHVAMYHWGSAQYRKLHDRLWRQDAYEWQASLRESKEELVGQFRGFMLRNGYDEKKTEAHIRRIEYDAWKLERDLSRHLAFDIEALLTIAEWPEEITAKGHYSVSFRWFRKFVESDAVAAAARSPQLPPGAGEVLPWATVRPPPQESPSEAWPSRRTAAELGNQRQPPIEEAGKQTNQPQDEEDRGLRATSEAATSALDAEVASRNTEAVMQRRTVWEKKFQEVAKAAEPCVAVAEAMAQFMRQPRTSCDRNVQEAMAPAGPSTSAKRRCSSEVSLGAAAWSLSSAWAELLPRGEGDASDWSRAQRAAAKYEGAARRLLASGAADADQEDERLDKRLWLWVFAGLGEAPRGDVASRLVERGLRRASLAWADLMVCLVCCAWSPYAPPHELLPAVRRLAEGANVVRLDFASVLGAARRGFERPRAGVASLKEESAPALLKWATFGSLMAEAFARDTAFELRSSPAFAALARHWQTCSTLTKIPWCALSCFLSAFLWRIDPEEAARLFNAAAPSTRIPTSLMEDFRKIQLRAQKASAVARGAAAAGDNLLTPPKAASVEASVAEIILKCKEGVFSEADVAKAMGNSSCASGVLAVLSSLVARGLLSRGAEPRTYSRKRKAAEKLDMERPEPPPQQSEAQPEAQPAGSNTQPPLEHGEGPSPSPPDAPLTSTPAAASDAGALEAPWDEASQQRGPAASQVPEPGLANSEAADERAEEQGGGRHAAPALALAAAWPPAPGLRQEPATPLPPAPPARPQRGATRPALGAVPPLSQAGRGNAKPAPPPPAVPAIPARGAALPLVLAKDVHTSHGRPIAVEGTVCSRFDFKKGSPPGFQVRLKDSSGFIDAKFWDAAADRFRANPALARGARVRLEGFYIYQIPETETAMRWAAPGRIYELRANRNSNEAQVTMLEEARKALSLEGLASVAEHEEVILEAHVRTVGTLEDKLCQLPDAKDVQHTPFRCNVLTSATLMGLSWEWHLFRENAERWGNRLKNERVRIHGTRVRVLGARRILSGCRNVEIL